MYLLLYERCYVCPLSTTGAYCRVYIYTYDVIFRHLCSPFSMAALPGRRNEDYTSIRNLPPIYVISL